MSIFVPSAVLSAVTAQNQPLSQAGPAPGVWDRLDGGINDVLGWGERLIGLVDRPSVEHERNLSDLAAMQAGVAQPSTDNAGRTAGKPEVPGYVWMGAAALAALTLIAVIK